MDRRVCTDQLGGDRILAARKHQWTGLPEHAPENVIDSR
jgi:hypothetical protein